MSALVYARAGRTLKTSIGYTFGIEIAATEGYDISQLKRKLIGPIRQVMVHGVKKVDQLFMMTAYNLVRMRTLGQVHLERAQ